MLFCMEKSPTKEKLEEIELFDRFLELLDFLGGQVKFAELLPLDVHYILRIEVDQQLVWFHFFFFFFKVLTSESDVVGGVRDGISF